MPLVLSEAQLAGEQPIEDPLPVGATLERVLLHRLAGLPAADRQGLLVAAASGGERVQPVVDALGALGLARSALESAERAGVLSIVGERFEFRHPLLRSAIYHGASGPARRAAHAALARVTSGEPRAWHLAHATVGEDEAVAATLERAGLTARRRGAPAAADRGAGTRCWLVRARRGACAAPHRGGARRPYRRPAGRRDAPARRRAGRLARRRPAGRDPARPRADPRAPGSAGHRVPAAGRRGAAHPRDRPRARRGDAGRSLHELLPRRRRPRRR